MRESLFLFPATLTVNLSESSQLTNAVSLSNRLDTGNFPDNASDFIGYLILFARSSALR